MTITEDQKNMVKNAVKRALPVVKACIETGLFDEYMHEHELLMAAIIKEKYPNGLPKEFDRVIEEYNE